MKKFATVLLSICLILSMCVASFAAVPDLTFTSSTTASIREVVKDLGANPSDTARETVAKEIISILEDNGAESTSDLRSSAKILLTNGIIDEDLYNTMISIIDTTESEKQDEAQEILDKMKEIINDGSLSTTEKAQKIYALIKDLPAEEAQKILDAAKDAGIIDEETYNKISDLFNGNGGDITLPDINNAGSGIKDLVSKILDKIGIGGGDSDDSGKSNSNSNSGSSSSSSSNKTDFEGGNAKTGDYAVASVAGVAAVAGAVLVLTRKKNEDK